jgi:hypothetical protein
MWCLIKQWIHPHGMVFPEAQGELYLLPFFFIVLTSLMPVFTSEPSFHQLLDLLFFAL